MNNTILNMIFYTYINVYILNDVFLSLTLPNPKLIVGNDVSIGTHTIIAVKNLVKIGDYTRIAPFVYIADNNHSFAKGELIMNQRADIGEVVIGKDVWIGSGARILKGITVGDGAVIGAGTIVTKDIPSEAIVVGNPGRVVGYRQ